MVLSSSLFSWFISQCASDYFFTSFESWQPFFLINSLILAQVICFLCALDIFRHSLQRSTSMGRACRLRSSTGFVYFFTYKTVNCNMQARVTFATWYHYSKHKVFRFYFTLNWHQHCLPYFIQRTDLLNIDSMQHNGSLCKNPFWKNKNR